jgi:hypothetical protein
LFGNFAQSFLQSSGAFEVYCNGQLVGLPWIYLTWMKYCSALFSFICKVIFSCKAFE